MAPANGAAVFELAKLIWAEIEAAAADFDPTAPPPPVTVVARISADPGGRSTGYGTSAAGTLGVACFTGTVEAPTFTLAGPFPVGP